ncbi:MAG: LuxR C-terminal-related transcriptional regulator [Anaerolineae bacterium]|jgi:LuxR family maltose regulon positive regulatory protein
MPRVGRTPDQLLTTKLHIPSCRPEWVPRARLIDRLNASLAAGRKLTLVSAPAGFGKTTLLSDWLRQTNRPVAWLSLDEGDNDQARFLAYLITALQRVDPQIGQMAQAMLQAPRSASQPEPLLTTLINDIVATAEPFILVLDDYHVVEASSIHEMFSFLLDHLPPSERGMHLVIATRADPPWPLARLRARGQLTELHAADLRFSRDEAQIFFNEAMGLSLAPGEIAALEKRTEGWATGLQLAALSLRGRDDVPAFISAFTGSHRYVLDYLTEEVLNRQSEDVRAFLLQTAILDRLTGPLCDTVRFGRDQSPGRAEGAASSSGAAVTERVDSQRVLESLEAANLFIVPLDQDRRWYRYHHLFADLLRHRLLREQPNLEPELHRRASEWYEREGLITEAIGHALTCGDFERAACLIQDAGWAIFTRGEMATILAWIALLPHHIVRANPQLSILHAWAMAKSGDLDGAERCLREFHGDGFCGEVTAVRAYVAGVRGDLPQAVNLSQRALALLPAEDLVVRAIVAQNLGVAYHWRGDPAAAIQALTDAVALSRAAGQSSQTLTALAILGRAYEMQAALHQAMDAYQEALELGRGADRRPAPFACMAYVGMAGVLYEWNDLEAAKQHALEGIRLSKLGGFIAYQVFGHALLARVCEAQGDRDAALENTGQAEQLGQGSEYALVTALATELRVRLWLAQDNLLAAARWALERQRQPADELDAASEIEQMAVARMLIAQDRLDEALRLLASLLAAAQAAGRTAHVIKVQALQALTFQAQGDESRALSALEQALSLAEPEGYVRTFVDEGEPVACLLRRALTQGIASGYASWLLATFDERPSTISPATQALVEPLTERETEVLHLIAAGLTNREIAQELVIAVSTVKSHINHLYGKLEVKNRTQAVARGRELDLL